MPEKLLVTGGQGFLGAWIARKLIEEGTPFTLLDLRPEDGILAQILPPATANTIERRFADITDGAALRRAIEESEATRIIHLAGLQIPACKADPLLGARVNVLGTLNVFEAARALRGQVRSVVYASSAAVAGRVSDYHGAIADDTPHVPRTHYGVFKTANEGNARVYFDDHDIPSVGLRPLVVYGVGREVGISSAPTKAIKSALLGRPFRIGFRGPTGFAYCEDMAATFIACSRVEPRGALALNMQAAIDTVERFVSHVETAVPSARGLITYGGEPLPVAYDFAYDGLEALLGRGKVPFTPLEAGIEATARLFGELQAQGRLHDRDLAG